MERRGSLPPSEDLEVLQFLWEAKLSGSFHDDYFEAFGLKPERHFHSDSQGHWGATSVEGGIVVPSFFFILAEPPFPLLVLCWLSVAPFCERVMTLLRYPD